VDVDRQFGRLAAKHVGIIRPFLMKTDVVRVAMIRSKNPNASIEAGPWELPVLFAFAAKTSVDSDPFQTVIPVRHADNRQERGSIFDRRLILSPNRAATSGYILRYSGYRIVDRLKLVQDLLKFARKGPIPGPQFQPNNSRASDF